MNLSGVFSVFKALRDRMYNCSDVSQVHTHNLLVADYVLDLPCKGGSHE